MSDLSGDVIDKVIAFVRKWAIVLAIAFILFILFILYLIFKILANYSILIFMGLMIYAYIKRDHVKAFFVKMKLAVQEYNRKNNSNR